MHETVGDHNNDSKKADLEISKNRNGSPVPIEEHHDPKQGDPAAAVVTDTTTATAAAAETEKKEAAASDAADAADGGNENDKNEIMQEEVVEEEQESSSSNAAAEAMQVEKEDAPAAADADASTAPAVDATASGDASGTNSKDEDGDVIMGEESSNAAGGGENVSASSHEKAKEETAASNNVSSNTIDPRKDDNPPKSESKEKEESSGAKETSESTNGNGEAAPKVEKEETSETTKASSTEENKNATSEKTKASSTEENKNASASTPPPPVMKGTLSIDLVPQRRHLIRGMWNYENSNTFPPQRFELVRNLGPDEDEKKLPVDGEFHGSFSLAYVHTTSKGKQKERSKVIPETGVNIKFTKAEGDSGEYKVDGKGTNQFGVFHINGTATPSSDPADSTMSIVLRKRYEPGPVVADNNNDTSKSKSAAHAPEASSFVAGPLPEPAKSFPSGVVALRGNLFKEESNDLASGLGSTEVVHRITGMWASGLDLVLADPQNVRGICNRFEYEHKSTGNSQQFPVSGRYSGWFDLSGEDGSRTRINERDVMLKFRNNNAGYHNIEGRGSNVFGKYTITGTLTKDNVITIFRHFQPRKLKKSAAASSVDQVPSAAPLAGGDGAAATTRRPSSAGPIDPKLKLDDVKIPGSGVDGRGEGPLEPIIPPQSGTYSAVSRGVLRINEDGSHSCQGKWSVTREHFTNGATSNFNFRLEPHFAKEAAEAMKDQTIKFPLDSAMYKGTFQLKKQGTRYQTIVDQQIVMKFRKNKSGAYNVHGTGVNAIGEFNLLGTLVTTGKGTGGQVELYRTYPPDKLAVPQAPTASTQKTTATTAVASSLGSSAASLQPPSSRPSMQRRESSRSIKLPSRLEEDDPDAQLSRTLDKCSQILKFIREKDVELGAFFSEPVDPVALGIPTYFQIVKEPMDLRTIHRRMEANQIPTPEEFARLVRLVFENAMRFNLDPAHSVHQAARSLLTMFNQKFRDVDRTVQSIRRTHGIDVDGDGKKKGKDGKKKKEIKSLRQTRLDEADAMNAANASAIAAIVASAPATQSATVSRTEFNMLLHVIQQLQSQVVQTHKLLADLSPGDPSDAKTTSTTASSAATSHALPKSTAPAPAPEKKKAAKRKSESISKVTESVVVPDDSAPLSLEEQELLTDTINELPEEHLGAVIQIIREAAPVGADEDEIDLEIDQLDTRTQRKLLRHIQKFVKKSKVAKKKKTKKKNEKAAPPPKKAKPAPKPKPAPTDTFFAFGAKDGSDSDSDDDDDDAPSSGPMGGKSFSASAANEFKLGDGLDALHDDHDDDLDDVAWNIIPKPETESEKKDDDKDDDWGAAAREQAAAAKARDADRKAREEKKKAEAEQASKLRLADAAARGEELKAQRAEEEAKEASLREQQEKEAEEARQAAKEEAKAQLESVEQTVDLDAQRDIMKQYDFVDKDLGGASPSSDFGF